MSQLRLSSGRRNAHPKPLVPACRKAHRISRRPQQHLRVHAQRDEPVLATYSGDPIPVRLNNIPHTREVRRHFYREVAEAAAAALAAGELRLTAKVAFPELNTDFDVYRAGTLLELAREVATKMTADGKRVKICVQQSLGKGVFQGMPMPLNGVMRIMQQMDWGDAVDFIQTGNLGANEVDSADAFVLIAPQNVTGTSVLPLVEEMTAAAEAQQKPIVMINPQLGDIAGAGVMTVRGRQGRMDFVATYKPFYHFRLLYKGAYMYPIMGALRHTWGGPWEVFRRVEFREAEGQRQERYELVGQFEAQPDAGKITACFTASHRTRNERGVSG